MLEAVNDYILQYTDVQQDNLFRGYQNRSTLPQTQDYTMYWLGDNTRIGTNVDEIGDFKTTVKALREYTVSIDFCGDDQEKIERRAMTLAVLGRRAKLSWNLVPAARGLSSSAVQVNQSPAQVP